MPQRGSDWRGRLVCACRLAAPRAAGGCPGGRERGRARRRRRTDQPRQVADRPVRQLLHPAASSCSGCSTSRSWRRWRSVATAIKQSLDEAQAARAEAVRQQEENEAQLRAAYAEAAAIREQALKEAAEESAQAHRGARRPRRAGSSRTPRRSSTPKFAARAMSCAARSAISPSPSPRSSSAARCARRITGASWPRPSPAMKTS